MGVLYLAGDIGKRDDVERLLAATRDKFGPLHGILHSAGVNRDSFIIQKTKEHLETVYQPKVQGTLYLDRATAADPLDFFITFSSISALMGNPGQCGYAYGNRFMDYFAENRRALVAAGSPEVWPPA